MSYTFNVKLPHWAALVCAVVACGCLGAENTWPAYAGLLKAAVYVFGSLSGGIFAVSSPVVTKDAVPTNSDTILRQADLLVPAIINALAARQAQNKDAPK